jgi:hypothetical protein
MPPAAATATRSSDACGSCARRMLQGCSVGVSCL